MGLKGADPYFQRIMASKVLAGLIYRICELYIDDMLIHATTESDFLINLRQVFQRFREHNIAANPRKTKLHLTQVEYVCHLISAEGTSFTVESFELNLRKGFYNSSDWAITSAITFPI